MTKQQKYRMNISFWLRSVDKSDTKVIYCTIYINGDRKGGAFSTNVKVETKKWDTLKQRIKGNHIDNLVLEKIYEEAKTMYLQFCALGKNLTAQSLKEMYLQGFEHREICLLDYTKQYIDKQKQLVGKSITASVHRRWKVWLSKLENFLQLRTLHNVLLKEITEKHFKDFTYYLVCEAKFMSYKVEKIGYSPEIIRKDCNYLKHILQAAYIDELIDRNRIAHCQYSVPKNNKELIFLEVWEIERIANFHFAQERLQKIADLFVFACYTGFAYCDLISFNSSHISISDGKSWLQKERIKTGNKALLPFFKQAKGIWEKYGSTLPTLSNGKYNEYLKEVALICGINKHITTHTGRRTAAMMFYENGFDMDTVATMVGHSTAKTTRKHYTKTRKERIAKQLNSDGKLSW